MKTTWGEHEWTTEHDKPNSSLVSLIGCLSIILVIFGAGFFIGKAFGHPAIETEPVSAYQEISECVNTIIFNENPDGTISYVGFTTQGDMEICVRGNIYQSLPTEHDLIFRRVHQGEAEDVNIR